MWYVGADNNSSDVIWFWQNFYLPLCGFHHPYSFFNTYSIDKANDK